MALNLRSSSSLLPVTAFWYLSVAAAASPHQKWAAFDCHDHQNNNDGAGKCFMQYLGCNYRFYCLTGLHVLPMNANDDG